MPRRGHGGPPELAITMMILIVVVILIAWATGSLP